MTKKDGPRLLVGTRKGVFTFTKKKKGWKLAHHGQVGEPIPYVFHDARTDSTWCSIDHGHWGQKLARSRDGGLTYEAVAEPKYPVDAEIKPGKPAVLRYLWVLAPGHASEPDTLYIGTEPGGLFVSRDDGATFEIVEGLWNHPSRMEKWMGGGRDEPGVHSVLVDARDARRIVVAISTAGVFESKDKGASWTPRNVGLVAGYAPDTSPEVGHDAHFVEWCDAKPDVVWQQNHWGIYRSTDGTHTWKAVHEAEKKGRRRLAYFGFPIAADALDPKTAWIVPAEADQKRQAIDGALRVMRTEDGGKSWIDLRRGLPDENAHDVVYRHALDVQDDDVAFGSTTGNVYVSDDRGDSWRELGHNFPPVYCVRFAR
jgi:hypothetical protein